MTTFVKKYERISEEKLGCSLIFRLLVRRQIMYIYLKNEEYERIILPESFQLSKRKLKKAFNSEILLSVISFYMMSGYISIVGQVTKIILVISL